MHISEKNKMIFMSCIMTLLILIQHRYVYMYFDDYGYASLPYAGFENRAGMSYGLIDIKSTLFKLGWKDTIFFL
ncbi:MAG: hypothetical protein HFH74_15885 [Lachnospiraceae bacterium]|jgi:hypothetical protein|nr:hypothetical protein [Lachnospiraceae bacterium]